MTISKAVAALTVVLAIACWWVLPHEDFPDYGKFADDRRSHARNVFSNAGFLIVGLLFFAQRRRLDLGEDSAAATALFAGVMATAFGSAYFHASPLDGGALNRTTLLWDRVPMTIAFAGLLALVLRDRVFHEHRRFVLPLLAAIGVGSALYWYWSGDLYPYAFFQFSTAAGTLLMIVLLRPSFSEAGYVAAAVLLFGVAKLFEDFDHEVFAKWGVGGHPLKHVSATFAALMILLWLMKRRERA